MTFTRYEQLRAMRRACRRVGMNEGEIQGMFCDIAMELVATCKTRQ
jgi:hypothetical protein